ncbi:MAG: transposase [Deltaproteobacteria bacterium]|nr:transposase [Deltaproteobacteria bacterium]MBP6833716.1 transposase [Deltaproteobacteria bacterium]
MGGFNLHAGVRVEAGDRDSLERLCRYMARPAVAAGRVSVLPDGNVAYRVKAPRSGAATHRVMTPMEFMGRLSAVVAPPRTPLVRYHGVLAPNSPWRVAVVPLPPVAEVCGDVAGKTAAEPAGGGEKREAPTKRARIDQARLLWRVEGRRRADVPSVRWTDEDDRGGHRARGHRAHSGAPRASRPVVPRMRRARDGP